MIYLIITTCLNPRYEKDDIDHRINLYIESITETLKILPKNVKPIIVENNGKRKTILDDLGADVVYTNNNSTIFIHKGGNEFADIKEVIQRYEIQDDDIVVKITGRYKLLSDRFFNEISDEYDAFVKYFNVCTNEFTPDEDCVLGLVGLRAKYWKIFKFNYDTSPECEFAKYTSTLRDKSIDHLDLLCCFANDHSFLHV